MEAWQHKCRPGSWKRGSTNAGMAAGSVAAQTQASQQQRKTEMSYFQVQEQSRENELEMV